MESAFHPTLRYIGNFSEREDLVPSLTYISSYAFDILSMINCANSLVISMY